MQGCILVFKGLLISSSMLRRAQPMPLKTAKLFIFRVQFRKTAMNQKMYEINASFKDLVISSSMLRKCSN